MFSEHAVARLDIAVENAFGVSEGESATKLGGVVEDGRQAERRRSGPLPERAAAQKFKREKRGSIPLARLVDGGDSGVVEGGDGFGFTPEALKSATGVGYVHIRQQKFERDDAVEAPVPRAVDDTHAALAATIEDLVMRRV
jgi:hypothetical protein